MPIQIREYHVPANPAEARLLLLRDNSAIWKPSTRTPAPQPAEALIDAHRLGLNKIERTGKILQIGGQVSLETLATHPLVLAEADGVLALAANLSGHRGLRNIATLQGVLADEEGPPEVWLALAALDAPIPLDRALDDQMAELTGVDERRVLVNALDITLDPSRHGALARVARTPRDQALVAAVAVCNATGVRVAVCPQPGWFSVLWGSFSTLPLDARAAQSIAGSFAEDLVEELRPVGDWRASGDYRRAMIRVLVRRVVLQVLLKEARA